jgi:hypothetical protein
MIDLLKLIIKKCKNLHYYRLLALSTLKGKLPLQKISQKYVIQFKYAFQIFKLIEIVKFVSSKEQRILDTNAGEQQFQAATDV